MIPAGLSVATRDDYHAVIHDASRKALIELPDTDDRRVGLGVNEYIDRREGTAA